MKKENKKALITGYNGFIGRNLAQVLHENGFQVAILPRQYLNNPQPLEVLLSQLSVTHIFHLASYGNHNYQNNTSEIVTTNYIKTFFLLQSADKLGVPNFINFSSSSVYGIKDKPMKEDDTLETNTFYGATKVGAEYLCRAYAKQSQTNIVTIRPFSVYGPGEASHRFIPTVIDALENQRIMTLYEKPVHDWIYIEDFLDGVLKVVDNAKKLNGMSVNIGSGKQHTNKEVFDMLCKIAKVDNPLVKTSDTNRKYDTSKSWVSDNTLISSLGFNPKHTLKQGLEKTYEYYRVEEMPEEKEPLDLNDTDNIINKSLDMMGLKWEDIGDGAFK